MSERKLGISYSPIQRDHIHFGMRVEDERLTDYRLRKASARLRKGEVLAALASVTDPPLRAVIDHHGLDDGYGRVTCNGCDQGCWCDAPLWPCSTLVLIAQSLGVDMTDMAGDDHMASWEAQE